MKKLMSDKPTYEELEQKLQEAEQMLDTLRSHKVDAVIGTDEIAMMRLKEVEDQLNEQIKISGKRLKEIESIYRNVPVGLCVLDKDLKFVRVNEHLARMSGIPVEDHVGMKVHELLPNLPDSVQGNLRRVIETGEPCMDVELCSKKLGQSDDTVHWLVHWLPLYNKQEEVTGINMVVQDITDRKQYEKKLQKLNETLEERVEKRTKSLMSYQDQLRSLASQLSKAEEQERQRLAAELHDNLGQMLAMCKMKMDGLQKENDRMPSDVVSEITDIKKLVEDSLAFSRELMSDLKPPPTIDKEDVRATIEWLADKMKKHDLNVIIEDDGQPKRTSKEIRTTLLQSVRELLFNIIKHAGVKEAYIRMSQRDSQLQIIVEDEGDGFDPDKGFSDSIEEGGFGLFNIRERLDLLGCSMDIETKPGDGTKVTILAPVKNAKKADSAAEAAELQKRDDSAEDDQKIKVLLADDHKMMLEGLKKIVDAEDDLTVVAEASDGEQAVKLAHETLPDVVIMDVNMPRKDGIEATKEIVSQIQQVRVIGLSLHEDKEVVESMRSAGAVAYLTKSEAFETLSATIRSEARMRKGLG